MLARWLLILGTFATSSQVYGAHECHLACLVPLLWRPGGPWGDPGTLRSTRKDTVRPFGELFGYPWTVKHKFFISISRLLFLMFFGSESGCVGLENQEFGKGRIAKINFRRSWISHDSRVNFK